jgi:hypothetical protein
MLSRDTAKLTSGFGNANQTGHIGSDAGSQFIGIFDQIWVQKPMRVRDHGDVRHA